MNRYSLAIHKAAVFVDGRWSLCKESLSDTEWVKADDALVLRMESDNAESEAEALKVRLAELSTKLTTLTLLAARADLCSPAERAVLDACAAIGDVSGDGYGPSNGDLERVLQAEFARREAAK